MQIVQMSPQGKDSEWRAV